MFTKDDGRMVTSIYNSKMTTFFFDVDLNLPDDDICVYGGYQHTVYVVSLSNISIKTNFKQIIKINNCITVLWERDYIVCMTKHKIYRVISNILII